MRFRIALVLTALLCVLPPGVGAQGSSSRSTAGWHGATEDTLVMRAISRRGMQLADSTLLSYEADAHGFLTFLVQLGEGNWIPPRVVQSEELASHLSWWQPGRSAQRLVGRRDTTLLPANIGYYRDRYSVATDNLPDLVRLGDGQDVRDVPHPLSQTASSLYEFKRGDPLRIRMANREILVDEVQFRPRDDTRAAAVGSVFLDRESGAVVRLSMSFTRAAILDKRIETLVLTLENQLIETRYWLPYRQEVEVSRRSAWMDIPIRGVVRGRWQISHYTVNERIPVATTMLPRWSSVSRDSLRAHPFAGRLVDVLPPDVQLASDEELTQARVQVEAAVRAAALARPTRAAVSGRGISDFVRANRVEGIAIGMGGARHFDGLQVAARARYGTSDQELKGQLAVGNIPGLGGAPTTQLFAERDYRDVAAPERAGVTNSMASLLFGSDYTTQVDSRAAGVLLRFSATSRWQLRTAFEQDRPLALHATPLTGTFAPVSEMWSLDGVRTELRGEGASVPEDVNAPRRMWRLTLSAGASNGSNATGERVHPLALRANAALHAQRPLSRDRALLSITDATIVGGRDVPQQWLGFAGGPWSAPGYAYHEFAAPAMLSQRIEYHQSIPAPSIPLRQYGHSPPRATLAPFVQMLAVTQARQAYTGARKHVDGVYPSAGIGVLFFYDLVRADVARGLRDGSWRFAIDIDRSFWRIL